MTTQQQFLDMLKDIEPSSSTVAACSSAHNTLRTALAEHEEFGDVHVETFLSGSYKRDTAIRPTTVGGELQRPDVDIIAVTDHTEDDEPQVVLDAVYNALRDAGYTNLTVNRRSINVKLTAVDMDVVPVIEDGDAYLIPDIHLKTWLPTNPPAHTQWTVDANARADGRFKPLVKLFKWWRRVHLADLKRPKGFILECLVEKHMSCTDTSYESLFVTLLEAIRDSYGYYAILGAVPHLEDPGVPGNNVFSAVTAEEFKTFYDKVKEQASLARQAKDQADDDAALKLWRQVLGARFPASAAKKSATGLANSLLRPAAGVGLSFPPTPVYPNKPAGFA
ncbi:SMODS domain-containing nucleotidyltransferase [Ralstonia holmesii]|uniref:SMODS domain-containing nucleotidyltransferase n=1 Tax=Ralstonia holmesii TaxID=3058602 RepID=UPI003F1433EC